MRLLVTAAACLAALAAAAWLPGRAGTARAPASVQVVAHEFSIALSRPWVRSGPVIVELVNMGEDDHDLALRRAGGTRVYRIPVVRPGRHADREFVLRPGRYTVWCAIANHRHLGMFATLRVRP